MSSMPWLFVMVRRHARVLALLVALIGLEAVEFNSAYFAASASTRSCEEPQLTWSPTSVSLTLGTGQSVTSTVSLSSSCAFTSAVLSVDRTLAGFVQVAPATIASVPAKQLQTIQLTFAVAANAKLGTYVGTVRARRSNDDDTLSMTLPIQLTVVAQAPVSGQGATVTVPAGFQNNASSLMLGGPISLDNFGGAYLEGGRLPASGARMTVSSLPTQIPLFDFIYHELLGAALGTADALLVSGTTCTRQP